MQQALDEHHVDEIFVIKDCSMVAALPDGREIALKQWSQRQIARHPDISMLNTKL